MAEVYGSREEVRDEVLGIARDTLARNWIEGERDGVRFAYARPSPSHYPWQWYWDSCFHAIVWRRFDRGRARSELESAAERRRGRTASSATRSSGTARWTCGGAGPTTSPRGTRGTPRRSSRPSSPGPGASRSATRARSRASPPTTAGSTENRDLDGDGLLWIVQPDESGLDSSPKFDAIWGRRAHAHLRLPPPDQPQPQTRLGRPPDRRGRRTGRLRGGDERALVPRPPRDGRAVHHPDPDRALLGRGPRALPRPRAGRRGAGEGDGGRRRRPPGDGLHLVGARAACPAGPARRDRTPPDRGAPARPPQVLAASAATLGLSAGALLHSARLGGLAGAPATGAARPGSTPPG